MAEHHPEPMLIPIPAEFPVTWEDPGDEHLPLMYDRLHTPNPVTPLTASMHERYFAAGSTKGFERAVSHSDGTSVGSTRTTTLPSSQRFLRSRWRPQALTPRPRLRRSRDFR
ncbi:MAG: hypothetical protein VB860_05090 [Dehalococcoidia bacterium]